MESLASFGDWFTRDRAVGIILVLGYAKRDCLLCLEARLREMGPLPSFGGTVKGVLVSFGGSITRNKIVSILWGLGYAKWETRIPQFLLVGVMEDYLYLVLFGAPGVVFGHSLLRCTFVSW